MEQINSRKIMPQIESRIDSRKAAPAKRKTGLQKFFQTPKGIVFTIMAILAAIGLAYPGSSGGIKNVFLAIATGLGTDFVIAYVNERPLKFSDGALITGLIIGVILSPTASWYLVMFTTIIALLSKHILKDKRKPWINPAAFGLLVVASLFSTGESWWGGLSMLPAWMTPLVIVGGFIIVNRINKFPLVFSFFAVYMLSFLLMGIMGVEGVGSALRMPYINAALFLGFFMLTDPPTSPAKYRDQVLFGIIAGMVSGLAFLYISKLSYLLIGLLAANLWKTAFLKNSNNQKHARA